ncbi:MAG TPA: TetR/AcrR family transcriptional regulator [Nocardioides sp.]|nr:TetR/AcrR family transcriptional regulator [Nocardioides sp.]
MDKRTSSFSAGPVRIRVTTAAPAKAPKERLTRDRIVDAALDQMREHGYEAVSMRSIARALDTGPASLYAHVANREQLDQLLVERVTRLVPIPEPDPERWDEQLRTMLLDLLEVYRAHPGVARATMGMIPTEPASLRAAEALATLCRVGGIDDQHTAWALDMFSLYIGAVAVEEDIWIERAKAAAAAGETLDEEQMVAEVRSLFESLPEEQFPALTSMAAVMTSGTGEDRVRFAVELLVAGLRAVSAGSGTAGG